MRNLIKIFSSICFCICLLFFVGCKSTNTDDGSQETKDSGTQNYYEKIGYTKIEVSDEFTVLGDIINFDDGSTFAKTDSVISLVFEKEDFEVNGMTAVNFSLQKVLSAIQISETVYPANEFDFLNVKVSENMNISAVYSDFSVTGISFKFNGEDETISIEYENSIFDLNENSKADSNIENFLTHKNENHINFILEFPKEEVLDLIESANLILRTSDYGFVLFVLELNETDLTFSTTIPYGNENFEISIDFVDDLGTIEFDK